MLHIGFTGTRHGMTDAQRQALGQLVDTSWFWGYALTVHHGECVGADLQFEEAMSMFANVRLIHRHPGPSGEWSAPHRTHRRLQSVCVHDPKPHMQRNSDIVNASDVMIAAPAEMTEQKRGGTWATIRMARRAGKPLAIVWPDGTVTKERWP